MPHEPKSRHSKARKRTRRGAIKLASVGLVTCPQCSNPVIPHQVCKSCGYYAGKKIQSNTTVKVTKA